MSLWSRGRNAQRAQPPPVLQSLQDPYANSLLNAMMTQQCALASQNILSAYTHQQLGAGYLHGAAPRFKPSDKYPSTLGYRAWVWDMTTNELLSPIHRTAWNGIELRCEQWDEEDVVRGASGIHAYLVPDDWEKLVIPEAPKGGKAFAEVRDGSFRACVAIQGIVERFGKFVLGTDGWRAEWVQIRKLAAPTDEIGLALERAFPEVEIIYGHR